MNGNLSQTLQKQLKRRRYSQTIYEASILLISKSDKASTRKEKLQVDIPDEYRCKSLNKIIGSQIQQHLKVDYHDQVRLFL